MNGNAVNLALEGLPNYRLYEDGDILNLKTGKILRPTGPRGRNIQLWDHNKPHNVCVPILLRRYFDSELNRMPVEFVVNLKFMGFSNYSVTYFGQVWTHKTEQWMVNVVNHHGYVSLTMKDDNDKVRSVSVHTLVARAFVPNPYNYDQNGIEEDRIHNRAIDYSKYKKNAANYKQYEPKKKYNYI